ncbi:MAG: UbiA prenyltransferase family protein [Endomicrobium sp.]|nr:UbiA prenyltransferase family protein [Endomicrobium sp.]
MAYSFPKNLRSYLCIARFDHWIKQLFIFPGVFFAWALITRTKTSSEITRIFLAFISTCLIASANYVINEWLDADSDKFHPEKKNRPIVSKNLKTKYIILEYVIFSLTGILASIYVSHIVLILELWLLLMGILYNVRPIRSKELPYIDVLSESINNAIRFLIGWFAATSVFLPPVSIVLGYWMGGAFLMATKRFSEYRAIGDKTKASLYRKSFKYYDEKSLIISAVFYSLLSVFFCGIFLIKYRIELIIAIPFLCGLFCLYLNISFKNDSAVQKPEKVWKEKFLIVYLVLFIMLIYVLTSVNVPSLHNLLETTLIKA